MPFLRLNRQVKSPVLFSLWVFACPQIKQISYIFCSVFSAGVCLSADITDGGHVLFCLRRMLSEKGSGGTAVWETILMETIPFIQETEAPILKNPKNIRPATNLFLSVLSSIIVSPCHLPVINRHRLSNCPLLLCCLWDNGQGVACHQ